MFVKMLILKLVILTLLVDVYCAHRIRDASPRRAGLRLRQRFSAAMRNRTRNSARICYDSVGCFDILHPRSPLQKLPQDPEGLDTKFYLFNRDIQFSQPELIYSNDNNTSLLVSKFDYNKPLKVIIHGYTGYWNRDGSLNATNAYLKMYDCNVIVMDWSNGAKGPQYAVAAANTEIVGRQLGILLSNLMEKGLNPKNVHLIGFSLGAHVAACASEHLKNKNILIGRITGLDAASPLFRHNHIKEKSKKLDKEDAIFVDVLHTDSSPLFVDGFGLWEPIGHVDFFANGGKDQPGCVDRHPSVALTHFDRTLTKDTACSHLRAFALFLESLHSKADNKPCKFTAFKCSGGVPSYEKGQCFPKLADPNNTLALDIRYRDDMGVVGEDASGSGVMYFATKGIEPYCGSQLQISIILSQHTPPALGYLVIDLQHDSYTTAFEIHCELADLVTRNTELSAIGATEFNSLDGLKKMQAVFKFYHYEFQQHNETQLFSKEVIIEGVRVTDMYGRSWQYYGKDVQLVDDDGNRSVAVLLKKTK